MHRVPLHIVADSIWRVNPTVRTRSFLQFSANVIAALTSDRSDSIFSDQAVRIDIPGSNRERRNRSSGDRRCWEVCMRVFDGEV